MPIPFPDELIGSFLLRASYLNGYQTPKQMLNNAGILVYKFSYESICYDEFKFKKVIENLNLTNNLLNLIVKKTPPTFQYFLWSNNQLIQPQLLSLDLNKFCSICLENYGYWKKNWLLKPLTICPKHNIKLKINCSMCHNPLSSNRRSIFECSTCKFDLRKSQIIASVEHEIETNLWLINKLNFNEANFIEIFSNVWIALYEYFSNLDINIDYVYILKLCHDYFINKEIFKANFIKEIHKNLHYAHPRIQVLPFLRNKYRFGSLFEKILNEFPKQTALSPKIINRKISKVDTAYILNISLYVLNKRLKSDILYKKTISKIDTPYFTNLIIEDWLINESEYINKSPKIDIPQYFPDDSNNYYSVIEISKILCINTNLTRQFLKTPSIPTVKKYFNRYKKNCLSKEFVLNFNKKYIFLSPLAKKLDVPVITLKDKIASLNIYPILNNSLYPTYYSRTDVQNLSKSTLDNIIVFKNNFGRKKNSNHLEIINEDFLSLNEAALLLKISSQQVAQLIQHEWLTLQNVKVRPYSIPRSSIDIFLKEKNDSCYIEIDEALKILNCTFNELQKNWIMTGLLTLRHVGYWRSIPRKQLNYVLQMRKEFFTASEANTFLGMHRTHITNLVTRGLIKPYVIGNDNYSIRLFKKRDVVMLLQAGFGKK